MLTVAAARPGLEAGAGEASPPLAASALIDDKFFGRPCAGGCASAGRGCGTGACCTKGLACCGPADAENGMNVGFWLAGILLSRGAEPNGLGWSVNSASPAGVVAAGFDLAAAGSFLNEMAGIGNPHF